MPRPIGPDRRRSSAVTLVVATLTFASGLSTLVSTRPLRLELELHARPDQRRPASTPWRFSTTTQTSPPGAGSTTPTSRSMAKPFPSSCESRTRGRVPAGPVRARPRRERPDRPRRPPLAVLHKRVGDTVYVSFGTPTDGTSLYSADPTCDRRDRHLPSGRVSRARSPTTPRWGPGRWSRPDLSPQRLQTREPRPEPQRPGARLRPSCRAGVPTSAGRADMQRLAVAADKLFAADPNGGRQAWPSSACNGPPRSSTTAASARLRSSSRSASLPGRSSPGLTLAASVRRRRRDLGLLKALGFARRQLAAAVAWQATVAAVIGVVIGIPLGVASDESCGRCSPATSTPCPIPLCRPPVRRARRHRCPRCSPTSLPRSPGRARPAPRQRLSCEQNERCPASGRNAP